MRKVSIRILILIVAGVLILVGNAYKYYEWNTIHKLAELYNAYWKREFKLVEVGTKKGDDYYQFLTQIDSPKATSESHINQYPELKGKLNVLIENQENYRDLIVQERSEYLSLRSLVSVLFGPQGDFAKKLVNYQLAYLDNEIENTNRDLAFLYLQSDFNSVFNDRNIVAIFDRSVSANKNNIYKNFADISSIQSYTSKDFKFDHAGLINHYYPQGLDSLNKYKDYLSTYYLVAKDIVNGDLDSASYKYTNISSNIANLTLNYNGIFDNGKQDAIDRDKEIVSSVSNGAALIKQFKESNLSEYPLLPTIKTWKDDLVLCQMYDFKSTTIYHNVTSKYPSSKNFGDLLNELSSVNPRTDSVDKDFDKSIVTYTNDDKKVEFQCKDKVDGDTLTFTLTKLETKR